MRVLIVGASGFVGTALRSAFGPDAIGTYFSNPEPGLQPLDIRDAAAVTRLVAAVQPELIVHPAAQPNVDWCEDHADESYAINVTGTRHVVEAARGIGARYIFFSTDYVFSGRDGPYAEDAAPAPPNVYGRQKSEAEQFILEHLSDSVIVRVCGVYGFEKHGKNFVMALLAKGRRGEPMNVPLDQWGTPTYGDNLAQAVCELGLSKVRGPLHVVGPDYLSRIDFARLACDVLGVNPSFLRPKSTAELGQRAPRPLRGGLDNTKARTMLATPLLGPRQGLARMKQRLQEEGVLA